VVRVSAQGCRVVRGVGGGEGDDGEEERLAAAARRESGRGDCMREVSFPTKY
jgi:hypothetical protein